MPAPFRNLSVAFSIVPLPALGTKHPTEVMYPQEPSYLLFKPYVKWGRGIQSTFYWV